MSRTGLRLWRLAREHAALFFALALATEAIAAGAVCRHKALDVALTQFLLGAREVVATGHIQSTFLPMGYPALLGWAERAASALGRTPTAGIFTLQIGLMVVLVALSRAVLLRYGSARFATTAALGIGLDPQLLTFVKSITDTSLTLVALMALLLTLLRLRQRATLAGGMLAGCALAAAVLVRPNLLLLSLLTIWAVWPMARRDAARTVVMSWVSAGLVYALVTTAVHGRPFVPRNGPYNLYAGYNAHTAEALRRYRNAENSILPALADRGIDTQLDWSRQPDTPGVDDSRDARYARLYAEESAAYIRTHPGAVVRLSGWRLVTLLRESFDNREHRGRLFFAVTAAAKIAGLCVIPLWCGLLGYSRWRRLRLGSALVVAMAVLYVAPFVLVNADPRFRMPLEGVLLLDIARMLDRLRRERTAETEEMQAEALAARR